MFIPQSLGGLEVDPMTCARVIEAVSRYDSAAGWTLHNPSAYAHFCARLPEEGVAEVYASGPNTMIAGPFHPPMQARVVEDGYRISGRAPFASNCHDTDWIAVTAMILDNDQPCLDANGDPQVVLVYLRRADCQILDTWHVMGMRGTGSDDIEVTDAFVPPTRVMPMVPEFTPGTHYRGHLYRFPLMGVVGAVLPPVALGVARRAIEEVTALAQGKTPFGSSTVLRERASTQAKLARAEAILRSGRLLLYETMREAWEAITAGESLSLHQKSELLLAAAHALNSAVQAVELTYQIAGTSGIYMQSPLERCFRDAQVLRHHGFASESRYETVGQVFLGLPPEFGVVAF
jgi:alkylation response protein AidB-like acyl-CoA dehydrogenase